MILYADEMKGRQDYLPSAWRRSGSSGFLSPAWFDDRSMHRCDCLTERSLGA
jgi:hypothetical protein